MGELKVRTKSKEFYLTVFQKIKEGKNPSTISKELNISIQNLNFYIKTLKNQGYISKKSYGVWEIKKELKVSSLGLGRPSTNLHAFQINFPILSGTINDKDWQIKNKLNNWLPKYKSLDNLGGLTIRSNNNKSVSVFLKARNIENLNEIDNLAFKVKSFIYEYFKAKFNVILDVFNCEVKNLNLATEDKNSESMIRKGEKFELDLNKKAEKIFPKDKIDAKAWIDGSPFTFSSETNDKEWKRAYLQMPFMMREVREMAAYSVKFYSGHVQVVNKLNKILDVPEVKRHIQKKVMDKYQTKLKDYF